MYPGGKNGCGDYQRIINQMPPHSAYIEGFCGSGAVLRNKKPAKRNIAVDLDLEAINLARDLAGDRTDIEWINHSVFDVLIAENVDPRTLIYFDPPYPLDTRVSKNIYNFELSDDDHRRLLNYANETDAMVMISGYRCEMYDGRLKHWRRIDYMTQTRGGMKQESLWMNFPEPNALHDYSYLGDDYRDRENLKRMKERFRKRFAGMDRLQRLSIMEVITEGNV